MKYSKLIQLTAIGVALLLIPRRSSRQPQQTVVRPSDLEANSNFVSDDISHAKPKSSKRSDQSTTQSNTDRDTSSDR